MGLMRAPLSGALGLCANWIEPILFGVVFQKFWKLPRPRKHFGAFQQAVKTRPFKAFESLFRELVGGNLSDRIQGARLA